MVVRPHKMQQYEKTWIRWCNCIQLILRHYLGTQQFFLLFCFSFLDIAPNPVLIFHLHWSKLVKFGLGIWGYASKVELGYAIPWLLPYLHVGPGPHIIKISIVMFWNSTYVAYPQIAMLNAWVLVSFVCRMIFSLMHLYIFFCFLPSVFCIFWFIHCRKLLILHFLYFTLNSAYNELENLNLFFPRRKYFQWY